MYNVHVCKKREQEAMKVGIEFGSTPLSQTRRSSVIKSRLHPYHKMELLIPNRSVEAHRAFLVLAFRSEGKKTMLRPSVKALVADGTAEFF